MTDIQKPNFASPAPLLLKIIRFPLVRIILATIAVIITNHVVLSVISNTTDEKFRIIWPQLLTVLFCVLAYHVFVRFIENRPASELSTKGMGSEIGIGFFSGAALVSVSIGVLAALGAFRTVGFGDWKDLGIPLSKMILVGAMEELMFRAILFRIAEETLGSWISLVLTAGLFAAAHAGNEGASALGLGSVFVASALFVAAYMLTRRLWLCWSLHVGWNFTLGSIFSVPVSGNDSSPGLFQGELTGPNWLTGGSFGAEGSLVVVLLISAATVLLLLKAKKARHFVAPIWRRTNSDRVTIQA